MKARTTVTLFGVLVALSILAGCNNETVPDKKVSDIVDRQMQAQMNRGNGGPANQAGPAKASQSGTPGATTK